VRDDETVGHAIVLINDDHVRVAVLDGLLHHLLERGVLAPHGSAVWDHSVQFLYKGNCFLKVKNHEKVTFKFGSSLNNCQSETICNQSLISIVKRTNQNR